MVLAAQGSSHDMARLVRLFLSISHRLAASHTQVLITSGARRASDTLQLLAEEKTAAPTGMLSKVFGCSSADAVATQTAMDLVPSLHPAGIAPKCEELFDTLGYGPLTKFYEKDGGKEAYDAYAEIVAKQLGECSASQHSSIQGGLQQ